MNGQLLCVHIRHEHDVVGTRRRAREIGAVLGFDGLEQTRIATAVSELARNAFQYARGGMVEYLVEGTRAPQVLTIRVSDRGPGIPDIDAVLNGQYRSGTGMGLGIAGVRRLMDAFDLQSGPAGTTVTIKKIFPRRAPHLTPARLGGIASALLAEPPSGPVEEFQQQNQELLRALEELQVRQQELERVNRELEDTNRGVVALYAELDERADHLRRADELKTRFLSNMTHEFRTPVNSILALTRLLADRVGAAPDQKDELFYIRKSAQQLSELVDDLLDIAKVEAGKIEVNPASFEVASLFGALRGMLRPLLLNQSVTLLFEDPGDIPPIYSDESKISQILRNFISNALKFTEQGEVRVSARVLPEREAIEFAVADTGIGIPADDLDRVFDEFVQIENPLQRRVKGTGLGLPLAKRLAELLGGTVAVTSTLGLGSTFSIMLPIMYRAGRHSTFGPLDPGRFAVLVIEDAEADLLIYERLLSGTRFQLVPAPSAAAAASALDTMRPSAIILDLRLHGEEAWDLLTRLKREERTASIPLIVASTIDDRNKGLALGADAYGIKPISRHWLLTTLESLVPGNQALRVLAVDDEETCRFIIREMLSDTGYAVAEAASGAEGLRLTSELRPDVILIDLRLPDMTGAEMIERLRQDAATAGLPVVLITSQRLSPDDHQRIGELVPVLSKADLTRGTLRTSIEQVLQQSTRAKSEAHP